MTNGVGPNITAAVLVMQTAAQAPPMKDTLIMATLFIAESAGMADGLTQNAPRTVPPQFSAPALADAYLEAFDRMRQSLRGCVPAPHQERLPPKIKPPAARKAARVKPTPAPKPAPAPTLPPKPPMEAALERLLQSA